MTEETFQERVKRENAALVASHKVQAEAIAKALSNPLRIWDAVDRDDFVASFDLVSRDAEPEKLHLTWGRNLRLEISGGLAQLWEFVPRDHGVTSITVSIMRSGEEIAREINRRLLPNYRQVIMLAKDAKKQRELAVSRAAVVAKQIMIASGGKQRTDTAHVDYYSESLYGDFDVNAGGETVSIKLGGVPAELAVKIAALIGGQ